MIKFQFFYTTAEKSGLPLHTSETDALLLISGRHAIQSVLEKCSEVKEPNTHTTGIFEGPVCFSTREGSPSTQGARKQPSEIFGAKLGCSGIVETGRPIHGDHNAMSG